jgi:hypothetical protein
MTACSSTPTIVPERAPADLPRTAWAALPDGPLSARHSALAVPVRQELLLLGGRDTPLCPPNASCVPPSRPALADTAAYDLVSRTWRKLAPLPTAASSYEAQAAALGDAVHVLVTQGADAGTHLRYDVRDDVWERLPAPPDLEVQFLAAGDVLVASTATQEDQRLRADFVYTPLVRKRQALPRDPLAPSFDRALTWTGEHLVLTGAEVTASPGGEDGPTYVRSAILDLDTRTWARLPDQTDLISYGTDRSWDGEHVVSPYLQHFDGGQTNGYGRALPTGGLLDLGTGQWAPLPEPPSPGDGQYRALSRRWFTAGDGLVLDTDRDRWLVLPDHDPAVDQGEATAWVGDQLFIWGGGSATIAGNRIVSPLVATGSAWTPGE